MFGAKKRLAGYLDVIRPWVVGKDKRGWKHDDFEKFEVSGTGDGPRWVPIPEVEEYRTDPSHVIFPLVPYDLTIDRLFLSTDVVASVFALNQKIASFNATLERFNAAQEREVRWNLIVMLHAGLIGGLGGAGLYEQFRVTEATLGRVD